MHALNCHLHCCLIPLRMERELVEVVLKEDDVTVMVPKIRKGAGALRDADSRANG